MKRLAHSIATAFLWAALCIATVRDAGAGAGLSLNWNDCPLSPASQAALITPCENTGREDLIASFELAAPVDSVIALEVVVDVQGGDPTLPSWWQYGPGGCRYGQLIASGNFSGLTACGDPWQNASTFAGPPVYVTGAPRGGANQARIVASLAVLSSEARALLAGTRYYATRFAFQNEIGSACPGCQATACLLLNSIRLVRIPGAVSGDVVLDAASDVGSNRVTWQSINASCDAVPVRRLSWGQIKMLYR